MLLTLTSILTFLFLAAAFWAGLAWLKFIHYQRAQAQRGCIPLRKYPGWDKILGLDYVYAMMKALKEDRFLDFQDHTYSASGSKNTAWTANFLGNRMVYTCAAANLKALSTSQRDCFEVEPIRVGNGAVTPFTGRGVSLSDGKRWESSRRLVMPYFDRAAFSNVERLGTHVDRLLHKIPKDQSTIDMQPLLQRLFLDTATDFLFGETVNSLENPEMSWPHTDMLKVHAGLRTRLQLSSFVFLHRDNDWLDACQRIHGFLDTYIDKAYRQLDEERESGKLATYSDGRPRNDFLWTIARHIPEKLELRTQLTGVWIPSNETTSILISNTIFALSRNPRIVQKLRKEIVSCPEQPLTFERLRSLVYLRWIINESHRLYPVSLQTVRYCVKDTVLPSGGGDGSKPIFCARGDIIHCNRYLMHRDPAIWGDDAEEFRPERWAQARPLWNFAPFGGGPRICPASVMVDTECAYTIFRIFERFVSVEPRETEPYTAVMRVGPSNKNGCKVAFVPVSQEDL